MAILTEIFDAYGYRRIPFETTYIETADSLKISRLIGMAVNSKRTISVVGPRGVGKTWAIEAALKGKDFHRVHIENDDKEAVRVPHIQQAFFATLSHEAAKRNGEIRSRQLTRIIGEAARTQPVVLMIEEAHRLHGQTLRSLKTMLEKEWMGNRALFVPVLIAQYDPMSRPDVAEMRLRSDVVTMHGLSSDEAARYIKEIVGKHFETDAIEAASRIEQARNYLELQGVIASLMERALMMGRKVVSVIDVYDLYHGGLKEMAKVIGADMGEMQDKLGLSKTLISNALNDKQGTTTDATFTGAQAKIGDFLREKYAATVGEKKPSLKAV
ncbi:MAG: AAA family ATPase [Nitrospiraceae bacterium]|nr:AAA family ATPase [Nitrospiraceae bacterium]